MRRVRFRDMPLEPGRSGDWARVLRLALVTLLILSVLPAILRDWLHSPALAAVGAGWDALVLVLSACVLLAGLTGQLPAQNVALVSVIILFSSTAALWLTLETGIPFGPLKYTSEAGPRLASRLAWFAPLVWLVVILTCRGVARFILRPWRGQRNYGFTLMGLTAALAIGLELMLEPLGTTVRSWWAWDRTRLPWDWYRAPISNFVAWLIVLLLILLFATPALIRKSPTKSPPDYYPILVWFCACALLMSALAARQLWPAFALGATLNAVVLAFLCLSGRKT